MTAQQCANALGVALIGVVFFGLLARGGYALSFRASLICLVLLSLLLALLAWRLER